MLLSNLEQKVNVKRPKTNCQQHNFKDRSCLLILSELRVGLVKEMGFLNNCLFMVLKKKSFSNVLQINVTNKNVEA